MNPNDRITPDNISNTQVPQQPAQQPTAPIQGSPFAQAQDPNAANPAPQVNQAAQQTPQAPAAPSNPTQPIAPDLNPHTPVTPQAAPVAPAAPAQPAPQQAQPTATPFNNTPAPMIQQISNPGSEYYREDTMQKAHRMRDILHNQERAWTYIPLMPGEKSGSMHPVGINGYFVYVRKGVMVQVPMQIAQMIAESFNQDRLIGAENDLSQNEDKQRALS